MTRRALSPAAAAEARVGHAVLDVRAAERFAEGHLAGSGRIAPAEFGPRRAELPPREQPLLVVADSAAEAAAAAGQLESMGYARVAFLDAPLAALAGGLEDRSEAARLWRPSPFLERVLPRIRAALAPWPESGRAPRALDLGAGSGRDAVHLAMNGFEVDAWDVAPEALARARDLAAREGVSVRTVVADLERSEPPIPHASFQLVTVFRFLHRPLFPAIERALAPGGWLVYETFRRGQERIGRPRNPRHLLESGELGAAFPSLTVALLEESAPPPGPFVARLLARRP